MDFHINILGMRFIKRTVLFDGYRPRRQRMDLRRVTSGIGHKSQLPEHTRAFAPRFSSNSRTSRADHDLSTVPSVDSQYPVLPQRRICAVYL